MQRIPLAFLSAAVLVIGIVVSAIPGDAAPSIDDAYRQMIEKRRGYEAVADRLALTKEFLDHHPDTKYTARLLTHVFYYQGERLDDRPGAIAYAEGVRGKVENPETVRQIDKAMVELYGDANMLNKMIAVADRLEAAGELDFSDYWNIVGAATANEEWKMVRTYCAKARPLANAQAYRGSRKGGGQPLRDDLVQGRVGVGQSGTGRRGVDRIRSGGREDQPVVHRGARVRHRTPLGERAPDEGRLRRGNREICPASLDHGQRGRARRPFPRIHEKDRQ
jgi:hypothetical protein